MKIEKFLRRTRPGSWILFDITNQINYKSTLPNMNTIVKYSVKIKFGIHSMKQTYAIS